MGEFKDGRALANPTQQPGFIPAARHMNATKVLIASLAVAGLLALSVAVTLDEPPGADAASSVTGIDRHRRLSLPRAEGGRILLDVNRQTFDSPWPLAEDQATLSCRPRAVATLITSSGEYGLSGRAIAAGYPAIWDSVLPIELRRRDAALAPLVDAALALCPETEGAERPHAVGGRTGWG